MTSSAPVLPGKTKRFQLRDVLPVWGWARTYKRGDLVGDVMAGLIVTVMLVPQSMAYALLAGLPPQVGLYASILPLVLYGLLGTSRALAVGPVAIVSLLVVSGVSPLAEPGSVQYGQLVLTLAFLVALIQVGMGLVRLGFLVNFMSHPVLSGFTSAAALVIGFSQLKHLLGLSIPNLDFFPLVWYALSHLSETNLITFALGGSGILVLLYFRYGLGTHLQRFGLRANLALPLSKSAPLVIVLLGTILVWALHLDEVAGVKIVGSVPAGLPQITFPQLDLSVWQALLPTALVISFVGYMESIAVAKSLASKRRQKVVANQELIALGIANLGATFSGGYPVTGGFSRSVVNFDAGANTGLASMITAGLIALTVIFLTPLFYFLPQAVLAAIVIVAVAGLIDLGTFRHIWRYNRADAISYGVTFLAVLLFDVEIGILIGVVTAILFFVYRTSTPHVAVVGRVGESEIYRNVLRHEVQCWPQVVAVRIDESLYFANTKFLEETVLGLIVEQPEVEHFVLIGSAINFIDASALETLEALQRQLKDAGVAFHLAAIKGPVMDRLELIGFVDHIGRGRIHMSTHEAMKAIGVLDEDGY
ncbi:MAG: solute carrier family 26 protein [Chloroflexi bacterium]|nr:solute carrier family 26 protein [Chloroflexota bacterium]MBP8058280.1 solute carrier family 26 protein [Chloroflexota bacterium]